MLISYKRILLVLLLGSTFSSIPMNNNQPEGSSFFSRNNLNKALAFGAAVTAGIGTHYALQYAIGTLANPSLINTVANASKASLITLQNVAHEAVQAYGPLVTNYANNFLFGLAVTSGFQYYTSIINPLVTSLGRNIVARIAHRIRPVTSPTPEQSSAESSSTYLNALETAPEQIKELCAYIEKMKSIKPAVINFGGKDIPLHHILPLGCILVGPPGCGKTEIAKALAEKYDLPFYSIKATQMHSQILRGVAKNIADTFAHIRNKMPKNSCAIVFIDEIEELTPKRLPIGGVNSSQIQEISSQVSTLLQEIQGFATNNEKKIIVIGATNRMDDVDSAILSRLQPIVLQLPSKKERIKAIENQTLKILGLQFTAEINNWLADETNNFSYRDLHTLLTNFARKAAFSSEQSIDLLMLCLREAKENLAKENRHHRIPVSSTH